ncbi:MAG TPA: hypothetical protein VIL52_07140 [Bacteroidota bacterium]
MKRSLILLIVSVAFACNPFAPGLDLSEDEDLALIGDPTTIDGVFQNIRYSYTFRDTTIYGQLLSGEYTFVYRDYDRGVDVSWGRDEDMRTTYGLFQNVQRLDLVWNNIVSLSTDSLNIRSTVTRNFNLTVTFNPGDIIRVDGYANLTVARTKAQDPWRLIRWRDESNF